MKPEKEIAALTRRLRFLEGRLIEEQRLGNRLKEMVKSLTAKNGYLLTLNDLATGMINRTDLDQLLETIVNHACTLAKTDHGFMHLTDRASGELVLKIGLGEFEKAIGMRLRPEEGVAGVAISTKEAFWVKDYSRWEGRIKKPIFSGLRACIALPLTSGNGTIGLGRFGNDRLKFSMTEVAMLRRFSHMASICIENAKLYRGLKRELAQRRLAEKTLHLSEKEFFSIFDAIQVGFYRTDGQGIVTMANYAAVEMMGYNDPREAVGLSMIDLYKNPEDRRVLLEKIFTEGRVSAYEVEMKKKDGQIISVLVNAHVRHNEAGEFTGTQGTVVDISHRKREETENVHSQKLEAIGSLAAGIAHEINTPIQYVTDNVRFLQDTFEDLEGVFDTGDSLLKAIRENRSAAEEGLGYGKAVEEADLDYLREEIPGAVSQSLSGLSRVSEIVRSMKEFSHFGKDRRQVADINHILENTLTVARSEWKYVARIQKELQNDLPGIVCNPGELGQVFLNILVNACHAIEDRVKQGKNGKAPDAQFAKGVITIQTLAIPSGIEIRISDTGGGIPEEDRDQIFNPFFTTKPVGRGSGQGLAIAHSVVADRHGGKISFTSHTGNDTAEALRTGGPAGTTFIIQLPEKYPET